MKFELERINFTEFCRVDNKTLWEAEILTRDSCDTTTLQNNTSKVIGWLNVSRQWLSEKDRCGLIYLTFVMIAFSCPFFRNELGGEEERVVALTRVGPPSRRTPLHRPPLACGLSVLEFPPGETHWTHECCPYQRPPRLVECVDQGALYYRQHFYQQG